MHHGFLDTSIPIDENTRILAIERPGIIRTLEYDSGITRNIWNTGRIETLDKDGKQIDTQQISNKATLLKILEYVDNELSKEVQKTVE